jgi:hypothetical protein
MRVKDYCGYCGKNFKRELEDPEEICEGCYDDPEIRQQYIEDSEYEAADVVMEADQFRESLEYL